MALTRTQKWVLGGAGGVAALTALDLLVLRPLGLSKTGGATNGSTTTGTIPQVTGLTATAQGLGTQALLTWQPVQVSGATVTYTVQAGSQMYQTQQTSYLLTGLTPNTQVQVQVRACVGG